MRQSRQLLTEILTQGAPCLFCLLASSHRRWKQNFHCFQCHKTPQTTLKGLHLASWPDAVWEKTFYFPASCCRDRWINYLLPILNHPRALLCAATRLLFSPQTPWADENRIFGHHPRDSRESGAGSEGAQPAASQHTWLHSPCHLPSGPRLAHTVEDQGLGSGGMKNWGWGRCSTAGTENLSYLWNCGQSKIHWVALIPPCFSGVVSEKYLCQAESTNTRW